MMEAPVTEVDLSINEVNERIEKINDDQTSTISYDSIDLYEDVVIEKTGSLVKVTATSTVDGIFENAKSTSAR